MTAELKLMSIPEIMEMAKASVDIGNRNGEVDWWGILSAKASAGHFDALVDEIAENGFGMPIVLCDRYGDGNYAIGNGHHRLCAAILMGLWRIPVLVSEGGARDDFMQQNDSMDDYGRPIVGYSYDLWEMLSGNMQVDADAYRAAWDMDDDDDEPAQFWCDLCSEYLNNGTHCCEDCHEQAAHPMCEHCDQRDCGTDHHCGYCGVTAAEYADHLMGCPERDYEIVSCPAGECLDRYRFAFCEHMLSAAHDEALSDDYGMAAEHAQLVAVGAAYPEGQWHPAYVLADAYSEADRWEADAPYRAARLRYEALIAEMREAVQNGAGQDTIIILSQNIASAWDAYCAL